jgi:hypothetical protein
MRKDRQWLPATVPINFQKPVFDGLIPSPGKYPAWKNLAAPLYAKYSVQKAQIVRRRLRSELTERSGKDPQGAVRRDVPQSADPDRYDRQ